MKQLIIISVLLIFATLGCSPKNGGTPKMDNTKNPRIGNYVKERVMENIQLRHLPVDVFGVLKHHSKESME